MTPAAVTAWVEADRARDLAVMREQLADDARLISPLTDGFDFRGADEVMAVMAAAFELLDDIAIRRVTGTDRDFALHGTATLRGANLEEIQWLHVSEDGLIDEITLFVRPMPAAVALLAAIGPGLARRGVLGRAGAVASRAAAPLAMITRAVESRLMPRLRRGRSQDHS